MNWNGKEIISVDDFHEVIINIENRDRAQNFMRAYRSENPNADVTIGYLIGYEDKQSRQRMFDWFGVEHPVFGTTDPSISEAFDAGTITALEGADKARKEYEENHARNN